MELITPPGHDRGGDSEYVGLRRHLQPVVTTWLTGLLAVLPLVLTLVLLGWAVGIVNRFLGPSSLFGRSFTVFGEWFEANPIVAWLLGTLLTLGLIYLLGLLVRSRLTAPFKTLVGNTMRRIPLVGSVYALAERFVSVIGDRQHADIAAMSPVWCFFGGDGVAVLALLPNPEPTLINGRRYFAVLVPTAPIPVGGGLLYMPVEWIKPAQMGMDTFTSIYVSMGITPPPYPATADERPLETPRAAAPPVAD